ncbi:hypothetical protein ACJA88_015317 [Fusarium oxysporum]
MSSIKKIALVGKGQLGTAILDQLLKAGFDVSVFSRSKQDAPPGATAVQVDYSSIESLSTALKGHDAVVSTVGAAAIPGQKTIIDAAILAGVKRFIPSDFASVTNDPKVKDVPIFQPVLQIKDYLIQKAQAGKIEYTIFATGPILEYTFGWPLFVNYHNRSVQVHGDGNVRISATSIAGIGKAVAGSLRKPEQTKNRVVHVHEAIVSQAKILDIAKKAAPEGSGWTETTIDPLEALQTATDKFLENPTDVFAGVGLIKAVVLSGKYDTEYTEVDNELFGLSVLSDEELEKNYVPLLTKKPE